MNVYELTNENITRLQQIAKRLAKKFAFSYYTPDDLVQECFREAMKALPKYDSERDLYSFFYTHFFNRLVNMLRDKYERIVPPCKKCHEGDFCKGDGPCKDYSSWVQLNTSKKNLMVLKPLHLNNTNHTYEENLDEKIDLRDLKAKVENALKPEERRLWLMYLDGVKLKKSDFLFLKGLVRQIIGEDADG